MHRARAAALNAAGFGVPTTSVPAAPAAPSGTGSSGAAELAAQAHREALASASLTEAALEAADSLVEFETYLKHSAMPSVVSLREESAEMRSNLRAISALTEAPTTAEDDIT